MGAPTIPAADHFPSDPHVNAVGGGPNQPGHVPRDTQSSPAGGPDLPSGQIMDDTQPADAAGDPNSAADHRQAEPQRGSVGGGSNSPSTGQSAFDAQSAPAGAGGPVLADPLLAMAADVLDDLERVRIANENRLRQMTRVGPDQDGLHRGFGLDETHPDVARLAALVDQLAKVEHSASLNVRRMMRGHPLGPWVQRTIGIGEQQAARLLAAIGDPYWNEKFDRPRRVSELWSYAGYGDAARQVRRKGQQANWSDDARKRAHVVAKSCVKQLRAPCARPDGQPWAVHTDDCRCSPYRLVYDEARRKYADAVHDGPCVRCGPSGTPAPAGSPVSASHQEGRGLRAVAKEVLLDLWREARTIHEAEATA